MRQVARHLPQALHEFVDAVKHPVESLRQKIELVTGLEAGKPVLQIAIDDLLRGLRHAVHTREKARADEQSSGKRQNNRRAGYPRECVEDRILRSAIFDKSFPTERVTLGSR